MGFSSGNFIENVGRTAERAYDNYVRPVFVKPYEKLIGEYNATAYLINQNEKKERLGRRSTRATQLAQREAAASARSKQRAASTQQRKTNRRQSDVGAALAAATGAGATGSQSTILGGGSKLGI